MKKLKKTLSKFVLHIQGFLESRIPRTSRLYRSLRWLSNRFIPGSLKRDYNQISDVLDKFSRRHSAVRFIQIGSCDGVTGDPIHEFVIRDGWEGILVEPLSYNFKLLTASYAGVSGINLINKAVSSLPGDLRFYRLPKELPGYPSVWRQISSLSEEHFRMSCVSCRIPIPEDYYEDVNTIAMRDLITMLDTVDVLHIDAEGIDCSLVMTLLKDSTVRPQLILFEANFIKNKEDGSYRAFDERGYAECCAMLKSSGYELLREGRDTLAAKAGQVCG